MLSYFYQYRIQINNFLYLSIVQFGNMVLPLVVLPLLLNRLGIEKYGLVVFSQSIAAYFAVFIRFGFNTYATQQVSISRYDKHKVNEIFIHVIFLELIFFIISLSLIFFYFSLVSVIDPGIYILSLLAVFLEILLPIWYFQGVERMKYITLINLSAKIISAVCIFLFVKNDSDYFLVPVCYLVGSLVVFFISVFIFVRNETFSFKRPTTKTIIFYIKGSIVFVLSDIMAILKDKTNIMLLGSFVGMYSVAYYDLAEKIVWAFRSVFSNINTAFFPYFVNKRHPKQVKQVLTGIFILSLLSYMFILEFSDFIILLLSNASMLVIKDFLWIMAVYVVSASISSSIGYFVLIANGYSKTFFKNMMISLLSYFFICTWIYYFSEVSIIALVLAYNVSILIELFHRIYLCKKYRLLS
ncbi:oligosaccharide flippase family protein [Rodentibacter pneumotropicus]|uniref:oligosaccharide flippase family protein n=1 Tax=Rodentibacter pneumotropicus TaxID=758 RepID=UPI00232CB83A|nr:oligosaccharide flippase family protein [Rodentibacter pneumotropicus]MDC2825184.1 oligosaccharide flippase family protein [Rodentibacter pneumotropicus]